MPRILSSVWSIRVNVGLLNVLLAAAAVNSFSTNSHYFRNEVFRTIQWNREFGELMCYKKYGKEVNRMVAVFCRILSRPVWDIENAPTS